MSTADLSPAHQRTRQQALVRVGLDLGGTGTRAVAIAEGARGQDVQGASGAGILASVEARTAELGVGSIPQRMDQLAALVHRVVPAGCGVASVGVGASGPVDVRTGVISNHDTLPWFSGFPFVHQLQQRLHVPVSIDNDAVVAAVGEHAVGAGRGCDRMLMVTLGTGVGCAMLVDARPVRGQDGSHPEGGHIPVSSDAQRCYCGLTGCWEQAASRSTLQRMLSAVLGGEPTAHTLAEGLRVAAIDPAIREVFATYGRAVGRGLAALHTLYEPRVTVVGGSAAVCLPLFEAGMREALHRSPDFDVPVQVRQAALVDNAGALGAALLPSPS